MTRTRSLPTLAAAYALALLAGVLSLWVTGAWSSGFSGADEPAHFLNSWFVAAYVHDALGQNPLAFATEYYLHYPKISIGHWPPAFYGLVAPVFWVAPATSQTAMVVNLLLAALPAVGIAALLLRIEGKAAAIAGAVLWALTPLALEGQAFFMLDQPLAACAVFAGLAWACFAERQTWVRILLFAGLTAFAILIKGNGWLLVVLPAFHIALTGRWDLLRSLKLWVGAAAGLVPVVPWYLATAGIAADGFNYEPGFAYASLSLWRNGAALVANAGILGLLLALLGAWGARRKRGAEPGRWNVAAAAISLMLATVALQALVPVDLDPRYMAPALPALVVLAVAGAVELARMAASRPRWAAAPLLLLVLPGAAHLAAREPKANLRMEEAAALAASGGANEAWLIDGGSGAEGAFVAAMAVRDPGLRRYTVRASKLLAESDFMGNRYTLRFTDPAAAAAEIRRLGISGVVVAERPGVEEFAHRPLLAAALADPTSGYRLAASFPHTGRAGVTRVYRAVQPMAANAAAIRALGLPDKAKLAAR
ncbi:MAG TPA: glycosyltransferase family 39 protein [Allosphingosinicella sp.]|jgi:4-amino-4-deoxy-L-arabinose transferase-like glycosyltransferase